MIFGSKKDSSFLSDRSQGEMPHESHKLISVSTYFKVFSILLVLIFVNIGLSHVSFLSSFITPILLFVAFVQTLLVIFFFMELINEDKFYLFIFGSAALFMILFMTITLFELRGRGNVISLEDVHYMRSIDKNGEFAPKGPEAIRSQSDQK